MSGEPSKDELDDMADKRDGATAGGLSEVDKAVIREAVNTSWPEVQMHLLEQAAEEAEKKGEVDDSKYETSYDGKRKVLLSSDSWWLKDFNREDVLMTLPGMAIMNTKPWHTEMVVRTVCEAYRIPKDFRGRFVRSEDVFTAGDIQAHIDRFPAGQFIAMWISGIGAGHVIGMATTMRTSRPPTAPILPWLAAIGDMQLGAHEPEGDWLYGVEMGVWPMYHGRGIGSALYEARFQLVKRLNLCGWYSVGMLMGYHRYADSMDVQKYGEKVIAGAIKDPTVTMQMNRGFRAEQVVTDYCDEPAAGDAGVLIVWDNPDYET